MRIYKWRKGAVVMVAALALGVGFGACGSDSDGDGDTARSGAVQDAESESTAPATTGSVKEQLAATVRATENAYRAGDAQAYCASLTAAGAEEVAEYAERVGQGSSCEAFIETASRKVRELGITQERSRIVSVRSDGKRATAMVSIDGNPPRATRFVKVDGRWKFKTSGISGDL